jgi:hypothetical protein
VLLRSCLASRRIPLLVGAIVALASGCSCDFSAAFDDYCRISGRCPLEDAGAGGEDASIDGGTAADAGDAGPSGGGGDGGDGGGQTAIDGGPCPAPNFVPDGGTPLPFPLYAFGITPLGGCLVGVSGGISDAGAALNSFFIYNGATNSWSSGPPMQEPRSHHSLSLISPTGAVRVLAAGGTTMTSAAPGEIFTSPSWAKVNNTAVERSSHVAVPLATGGVFLAGGFAVTGTPLASAMIFESSGTGTPVGALTFNRAHSAAAVSGSRVLVIGGVDSTPTAVTDLYDPAIGTVVRGADAPVARWGGAAIAIGGGRVVYTGGQDNSGAPTKEVSIWNPDGGWSSTLATLGTPRTKHQLAPLPDGGFLVIGGRSVSAPTNAVELLTATANGVAVTPGPPMKSARAEFGVAVLPNGNVLVVGGSATPPHAELFDFTLPNGGNWRNAP